MIGVFFCFYLICFNFLKLFPASILIFKRQTFFFLVLQKLPASNFLLPALNYFPSQFPGSPFDLSG